MSHLNPVQEEASNFFTGSALILAGAGSGKTTVITKRYLKLLDKNVKPSEILLLTFTNKAAKEMKERIKKSLSKEIRGMKIMTFHSFCFHFLKHYAKYIGFAKGFNIYTSYDQKKIYFEILKDMDYPVEIIEKNDFHRKISLLKNEGISWEDMPVKNEEDVSLRNIYRKYQEKMFSYQAMDFDDLPLYTLKTIQQEPGILEILRKTFRFVMIDEYQDTNRTQYEIAKKICEVHQNLFVVGDDDQSIYGFRGADIRNILDFKKDFPSVKIIKLEQNYRSTSFILQAANSLIAYNSERNAKNLFTDFEKGKKIFTFEASSPREEATRVAEQILKTKLLEKANFSQFAVLFRTNSQSNVLEEVFSQMDIPFISSGEFDFYERKEIKDIIAYLRLIHNPKDDLSFLRIINFPRRSINPKILKNLMEESQRQKNSLLESIPSFVASYDLDSMTSAQFLDFFELIERSKENFSTLPLDSALEIYLKEIEFIKALFEEEKDEKRLEKRLFYVEKFKDIVKDFSKRKKEATIETFLLKLTLYLHNETKEKEEFENAVHFLTIHAAKGLEFDYVHLIGMEEGLFPFYDNQGERVSPIEEERRLCYVAITRAKKELTLSLSVSRVKEGKQVLSEPSRFLSEIPDEILMRNYGQYLIQNKFQEESEKEDKDIGKESFDSLKQLFE